VTRGAPGLALLAAAPPVRGERAEVRRARGRGWAYSESEVLPGMSSVAAAIPTNGLSAACAVVFVNAGHDLEAIGSQVVSAAAAIPGRLT
jgi:DNA-binding IclR family transcriptional regulator